MIKSKDQFHLRVNMYGANILIKSPCFHILNYVRNNLYGYCIDNAVDEYDLDIILEPIVKPFEKFFIDTELPYYGSELYLTDNEINYKTKNLIIEAVVQGGKASIKVKKKMNWLQFLRKISRVCINYNPLQEIYRFGVEYPILALLNNMYSFTAIHASGVVNKSNEATLFFGLNGSGKSTLLDDMVGRGYRAIGENFILIKKGRAYSYPGLKKLYKVSKCDMHKIVGKAYGKYLVKEKYEIENDGYVVKRVNVVSRTNSKTNIVKLNRDKAIWFLNTIGAYLKEYENYYYTGFFECNKEVNEKNNYGFLAKQAHFYRIEKNIKDKLDDSELLWKN